MLREVETQVESKEQKEWASPEDQEVKVDAAVMNGQGAGGLRQSPTRCS